MVFALQSDLSTCVLGRLLVLTVVGGIRGLSGSHVWTVSRCETLLQAVAGVFLNAGDPALQQCHFTTWIHTVQVCAITREPGVPVVKVGVSRSLSLGTLLAFLPANSYFVYTEDLHR